ncbi:SseB family protein [Roseicyclus mahoneyensis]|uniref:Type III secretion system (T3SS) SseB-like protein n=1 Tax=Roseicyclus mahoneyensis TaxID=164332 RepID=A0A316GH22_9RHOB|nr:SseB family protein [Roseicyclus mahoneyensis]PWK59256.1 type III secretion system (T3SS) SseB-like protein [Roseicyclus mahoneyensis]
MTPLDQAHQAMEAAPEDGALRLRFYDRLAASELVLLLESEAKGDRIRPAVFPVDGQEFVLVFDREERLTEFSGGPAPYAALSGRRLAEMLAGQGIGLGVNLGVAPSSILIEAGSVDWLAATLAEAPEEVEERPEELTAPIGVPEALLTALDARLAAAEGLARMAYLVGAVHAGGRRGHLMAFIDAVPGSEPALARAVGAALTFSGIEAGSLDVGFFRASDPMAARLARVGLRFDLPEAPKADQVPGAAPGMDPDRPPRLR